MAPTPYTPSGQLDIILTVSGLTHRVQLPVDVAEAGGTWYVVNHQPGGSNVTGDVIGQMWWDFVKAVYYTAVTAPAWELQERDENVFITRAGGTLTGSGTNASVPALGYAWTITGKDATQHLARLQLPETSQGVFAHGTYASLPTELQDLIDSYTIPTISGELHDFVMTRNDEPWERMLFHTNTGNRIIRRARGLA